MIFSIFSSSFIWLSKSKMTSQFFQFLTNLLDLIFHFLVFHGFSPLTQRHCFKNALF